MGSETIKQAFPSSSKSVKKAHKKISDTDSCQNSSNTETDEDGETFERVKEIPLETMQILDRNFEYPIGNILSIYPFR